MKKFNLMSGMIFMVISLFAQPPQAFNYQAVVRNNSGDIIANQLVGVRINIRNISVAGTIIYQESHSQTTNAFGLLNLKVGSGTPSIGTFSSIDWRYNSKFIEVLVDVSGGTNYISMGTSELASTPYALYSKNSSDAYWGLNGSSVYYNEGNIGIGTTSPDIPLVIKTAGSGDAFKILSNTDNYLFRLRHTSNNSGALYLYNAAVSPTIFLYAEGSSYINSGNLGIGTTSPGAPLHVDDRIRVGDDPAYSTVYGELIHEGGGNGFIINANAGGGGWADINFQTNGTTKMFIESAGNVGIGTTTPVSRLDVRGNVTIRDNTTGNIAVELGTGLDYAEGFNVSDKTDIESGTVLSIDQENPGKLRICSTPYDTKVAGIVAGANNLGSGISLGTGTHDFNVALAGRVYCNVEAIEDPIEVGDLLTTSSLPGYAMKVKDREKAQGAILGKAMEKLEKGHKGQILVLVTLQ